MSLFIVSPFQSSYCNHSMRHQRLTLYLSLTNTANSTYVKEGGAVMAFAACPVKSTGPDVLASSQLVSMTILGGWLRVDITPVCILDWKSCSINTNFLLLLHGQDEWYLEFSVFIICHTGP